MHDTQCDFLYSQVDHGSTYITVWYRCLNRNQLILFDLDDIFNLNRPYELTPF